jgi:hypothetical protein
MRKRILMQAKALKEKTKNTLKKKLTCEILEMLK